MFCTPILFITFNRLHTSIKVFQEIKKIKPSKLYLASDGPRENIFGEIETISKIREELLRSIDWDCEVFTLFRDTNLGCRFGPSSAISWFFDSEEEGIILEDDCLPSQSFFLYCQDLLNKFREDSRIFLISGHNKQGVWNKNKDSYFFSHLGGIWGWASWRRAWNQFDLEMSGIEDFIEQKNFENLLGDSLGRLRKKMIYESIVVQDLDAWDYQWAFSRHKNSGLACVPNFNLIENIGFGVDASHTFEMESARIPSFEIQFPLSHPCFIVPDREFDQSFFRKKSIFYRILNRLINIIK